MPIAGLQVLEGKDPLAQHLVVVVVDSEAKNSQLRKDDLRLMREKKK